MVALTLAAEDDAKARGLAQADWWPAIYIHDEIVCTVPEADAQRVRGILESVMVSEMKRCIPDVFVGVEAKVARRWTK